MFKDIFDKAIIKWKESSKNKKIATIVLISSILVASLYLIIFLNKTKYVELYASMPQEDMANIIEKFKQDKVDYKLSSGTILVPENKVEELRLSIVSSGNLPSSGKGYELFDQSKFGMTDTEMRIQYQRALETELARTIKALDGVDNAIVHLVMPQDSVFIRDKTPASASVTIKLKIGQKLTNEQVKTIIALVSSSVSNLPKENVVVSDSNMNYLSQNIYEENTEGILPISKQEDMKKQFETKIEEDIKKMLEPVFGVDKVKVSVNADLNFDSKQISTITYDTQGIVKNQHIITESQTGEGTINSASPIDNQISTTIPSGTGGSTANRQEEITEYEIGKTQENTIKAPGEIMKVSTSVVIDGTLNEAIKASVNNIVSAATGYSAKRGDIISVEGMTFDDTLKKRIESDLARMQELQEAEEKRKKYIMYIGYPLAAVVGLIFIIILMSKLKGKNSGINIQGNIVDTVVGTPVAINDVINNTVGLDDLDIEKRDLASEIRKYANKKPDQVLEIVKSWLAEDER